LGSLEGNITTVRALAKTIFVGEGSWGGGVRVRATALYPPLATPMDVSRDY